MFVLGLDFETTGVDTNTDDIIEVGGVVWDTVRKKPVRIMSELVKTEKVISPAIQKLTGITPEEVEEWGCEPREALQQLAALAAPCDYIVAHNGHRFDRLILERYLARQPDIQINQPWIDTLTDLPYPEEIGTRKLPYLASEHGFLNPFSHRAVFDVLTMMKIFSRYSMDDIIELRESPLMRVVAKVSFEEKDKAKVMGFRWDPQGRQWYMDIKQIHLNDMQFPFPTAIVEAQRA